MSTYATPAERADRFLDHLNAIAGGRNPRIIGIESTKPGLPNVAVAVYDHVPEPGMVTGITYGLSIVDHELWTTTRPELCLTVATRDDLWMHILGELAERLRGDCPFVFGSTIDTGGPITDETELAAFVVFPPAVLDRADYEHVEVGDGRGINIVGVYPIHPSERRFIDGHGVNEFWQLNWDPFDVTRASIV